MNKHLTQPQPHRFDLSIPQRSAGGRVAQLHSIVVEVELRLSEATLNGKVDSAKDFTMKNGD